MTEGSGAGRTYWVGWSKSGVGKSMMTVATDHLLEQGTKVVVVECDTSNHDVWRPYREQVPTETVNFDEEDGWIQLVDTCDRHREGMVINTAARDNVAVQQHGRTLDCRLEELRSRLMRAWMVNPQRDRRQLLRELVDAVPKVAEHVLRHGCFVEDKEFEHRRSIRGDRRAANASRPVQWPRQP
jgi:hypothetical protein